MMFGDTSADPDESLLVKMKFQMKENDTYHATQDIRLLMTKSK